MGRKICIKEWNKLLKTHTGIRVGNFRAYNGELSLVVRHKGKEDYITMTELQKQMNEAKKEFKKISGIVA